MSLEHGNTPGRARLTRLRTTQQTAAQRKRMEAAMELLIAALDALDVTVVDAEEGDDEGEDNGDEEPSLGWSDAEARYGVPFQGSAAATDVEEEHDGSEPDEDGEPSLGAFEQLTDQRHAWTQEAYAGLGNIEDDPVESGIADHDGLLEQCSRYGVA